MRERQRQLGLRLKELEAQLRKERIELLSRSSELKQLQTILETRRKKHELELKVLHLEASLSQIKLLLNWNCKKLNDEEPTTEEDPNYLVSPELTEPRAYSLFPSRFIQLGFSEGPSLAAVQKHCIQGHELDADTAIEFSK